jgi:hypothetical protein
MPGILGRWLDRQDEARARRWRIDYGRQGWLLSWQRLAPGLWQARLSCPQLDGTFEGEGGSRGSAIDDADRAIRWALWLAEGQVPTRNAP